MFIFYCWTLHCSNCSYILWCRPTSYQRQLSHARYNTSSSRSSNWSHRGISLLMASVRRAAPICCSTRQREIWPLMAQVGVVSVWDHPVVTPTVRNNQVVFCMEASVLKVAKSAPASWCTLRWARGPPRTITTRAVGAATAISSQSCKTITSRRQAELRSITSMRVIYHIRKSVRIPR